MFDIGFLELIVVGVVALVVLGPERLPGAIRTVSLWMGRLRRSFNSIKSEIEKEIGADEIRRQLRNEEIMDKFRHTQSKVQNSISSIKKEADLFNRNIDLEAKVASLSSSDSGKSTSANNADSADKQVSSAAPDTATGTTTTPAPKPADSSTDSSSEMPKS